MNSSKPGNSRWCLLLTLLLLPVSAQEVEIQSLNRDGALVWSAAVTNGACHVEWASRVEGPWRRSWDTLMRMPATGEVMQAEVPRFFRVVYTPPQRVNVSAQNGLDLIRQHNADTNFVVLDVRTPAEFATRHVRAAVNVDFRAADFDEQLAALDRQKAYLVYCASGNRSGQASARMHERGFLEVYNLSEGFSAMAALPGAVAWLDP